MTYRVRVANPKTFVVCVRLCSSTHVRCAAELHMIVNRSLHMRAPSWIITQQQNLNFAAQDTTYLNDVLAKGADAASEVADRTVGNVRQAMGFLPRSQ